MNINESRCSDFDLMCLQKFGMTYIVPASRDWCLCRLMSSGVQYL